MSLEYIFGEIEELAWDNSESLKCEICYYENADYYCPEEDKYLCQRCKDACLYLYSSRCYGCKAISYTIIYYQAEV